MRCPVCNSAELVHDTCDVPYVYKGEKTLIAGVAGDFCPSCNESILSSQESKRMMDLMLAFNREVNASIVDPQFIMTVRKKLNLDQKQASEIFGGGVNAFSRYEKGRAKPPLALIKLFKVLDRHPALLSEIR